MLGQLVLAFLLVEPSTIPDDDMLGLRFGFSKVIEKGLGKVEAHARHGECFDASGADFQSSVDVVPLVFSLAGDDDAMAR